MIAAVYARKLVRPLGVVIIVLMILLLTREAQVETGVKCGPAPSSLKSQKAALP